MILPGNLNYMDDVLLEHGGFPLSGLPKSKSYPFPTRSYWFWPPSPFLLLCGQPGGGFRSWWTLATKHVAMCPPKSDKHDGMRLGIGFYMFLLGNTYGRTHLQVIYSNTNSSRWYVRWSFFADFPLRICHVISPCSWVVCPLSQTWFQWGLPT